MDVRNLITFVLLLSNFLYQPSVYDSPHCIMDGTQADGNNGHHCSLFVPIDIVSDVGRQIGIVFQIE